jgi:hypothetical protein
VLTGEGGTYSLVFDHLAGPSTGLQRVDASVRLQGLGNRSVAGRRSLFGSLYSYRATRVRGHRGLLLRARFSPVRSLVWREQGQLFELSTNTPRTIGVGALRSIAAGLQALRGAYAARLRQPGGGSVSVQALVADRVLSPTVAWTAPCTRGGGEAAPGRSANVALGWISSSAPLTQALPGPIAAGPPWSLAVSANVAATGPQMTVSVSWAAAAANAPESCSIGPLSLSLARVTTLAQPH